MKSDKSFKDFLKTGSSLTVFLAVLLIGVLLIVMSAFGTGADARNEEEELAEICSSIEGVGRCRTVITYTEDDKEVFAVAVLCEGAENVYVRERINKLVTSLYGIGSNRVSVLKIN